MKKINKFLYIIFLAFLCFSVKAEVITNTRNDTNNYGINKKWNINDNNLSNVLNTPYVNANEKIYDFSNIIDSETKQQLKSKIDNFIKATNIDMVIVTIDEYNYSENMMETYAADFYDYNDFGLNFEKYSGVLILRNSSSQNRYYNIYTFGDAQLYFSYNRLETTLDKIYNDLYNNRYLEGFSTFITDMENYYEDGISKEMNNYYVDKMGFLQIKYNPPITIALIVSGIITVIVMYILIKKNKMIRKEDTAIEYLQKDSINYTKRLDNFIRSKTTNYTISSGSSGSGGGFSSSGGSSGGGHSSGGGRHG